MTFRDVREDDREAIKEALAVLSQKLRKRGKVYVQEEDWEAGMEFLMSSPDVGILNDEYLIGAQVQQHWFSKSRILTEFLILRIYGGPTTYEDVVCQLEELAVQVGASAVCLGTAAFRSKSPVHNLLKSLGYQEESIQYIKEVQP